jgi:hypothetical protein
MDMSAVTMHCYAQCLHDFNGAKSAPVSKVSEPKICRQAAIVIL